jgi:biopolymer transport protein ExbB
MYLWNLFIGFFISGGPVMWPILAVSVVVWVIGLTKMFQIMRLARARKVFLAALSRKDTDPCAVSTGHPSYDFFLRSMKDVAAGTAGFSFRFREFLLETMPGLEQGFSSMNAWISVAPLLGLLGTVAGMIQTFEVIRTFGIGNPHMMSEGISIALLTTQAGLTAAFPGMLFHNFLINSKNHLAAGILKDGDVIGKMFQS